MGPLLHPSVQRGAAARFLVPLVSHRLLDNTARDYLFLTLKKNMYLLPESCLSGTGQPKAF